jgi:16S rRNA (uracil1498-N3)-methyltransferase
VKSRPRFYAPEMAAESTTVDLPTDEAQHLVRVLRLGAGDEVHLLNGHGLLREARIVSASKTNVTLEIGAVIPAAVESRVRVTLAQALLKGDKMDDVVRDAAMAGAAVIQPLMTAHTEPAVVRAAARRRDRWRTIAVGSAKQSGRAVVPEIAAPLALAEALTIMSGARIAFVEPTAATGAATLEATAEAPESAMLFVGPEGGWSADEVRAFERAGVRLVTLPGPTWRADAIGLIALVLADLIWHGRDGWPV